MDTLSFVLGIAFVVVIVSTIVAVYAFVKVKRIQKDIEDIYREIDTTRSQIYRDLGDIQEGIYRGMDDRHDSLVRIMDSRMDKLESKLQSKKELLKD